GFRDGRTGRDPIARRVPARCAQAPTGLAVLEPILLVLGTLLVTQAAVVATSVYLHRGLAHRALTLHPLADWVFRLVLWIFTGQNRRGWCAGHREHHPLTGTQRDPHTPLSDRVF